jgi:hypothetical protein
MNFALMHHHKWSITELEGLLPFERELYVVMLRQWLDEEHRRQKENELRRKT